MQDYGEQKQEWCEPSSGRVGPTSPALPANNLILIGTVHGDPRGYERVWRLLDRLRPEVVTVEISRFSVRYRGAWEGRWRRQLNEALTGLPPGASGHPAIQRVAGQIALPFEYRAARDYCRRYGAKCLPLDLGGLSRRHLPRYGPELLSPDNLRALLETPAEPQEDLVAQEFRRARLALERAPWRPPLPGSRETWRREFFVTRRLKDQVMKGGRIVHLGGWEHLIPWRDRDGLRSWLEEQKPYIMLADEGDFFPSEGSENP
ncbi:MAG: hypothetical protein HY743_03430 [Deltaproteobacteria bacterium]|nr:hypothetical protein [Deltaproteobacteria bacterium]